MRQFPAQNNAKQQGRGCSVMRHGQMTIVAWAGTVNERAHSRLGLGLAVAVPRPRTSADAATRSPPELR